MKKWNMIIDVEKCEDCNNCFMACKDEHVDNDWKPISAEQPRHGHRWMNIMAVERGKYPLVDVAYRPTPCMHCDDAPCIRNSPEGIVYKRADGIVIIDPDKSRGHKEIAGSCPYGAIWWNEEAEIAQKCTFCGHLLDLGCDSPRCAQACPTGAIRFIRCSDENMELMVKNESLRVLYPEKNTKPRVYYKNLHRFDKCFIAGSVSIKETGIVNCVEGAEVRLFNGKEIGLVITDNFGDFKFDSLEKDMNYTLKVKFKNYPERRIEINLTASQSIPDIILEQ